MDDAGLGAESAVETVGLRAVRCTVINHILARADFWADVDANRVRRGHCEDEIVVVAREMSHAGHPDRLDISRRWVTRAQVEASWVAMGPRVLEECTRFHANEERDARKVFLTLELCLGADLPTIISCHVIEFDPPLVIPPNASSAQ